MNILTFICIFCNFIQENHIFWDFLLKINIIFAKNPKNYLSKKSIQFECIIYSKNLKNIFYQKYFYNSKNKTIFVSKNKIKKKKKIICLILYGV